MGKVSVLLVSLLIFNFATGEVKGSRPLIVGGVEAVPGEFPFIVSLRDSSGHFCGGSLILPDVVLTAAHCTSEMSSFKVYVGVHSQIEMSSKAEAFEIAAIRNHPDYGVSRPYDSDFALVKLKGKSFFAPISLNYQGIDAFRSTDPTSVMAVVIGWGVRSEFSADVSETLQKVEVPLVSQEVCNKAYKGKISDTMLCAGYKDGKKDACQMDSGGPLVVKNKKGEFVLAGIVSWGAGCARPDAYGVYSKVSAVQDWIETEALKLSESQSY